MEDLFQWLNDNAPVWVVILVVAVRQFAEIGHKMIPDDSTGVLKVLDKTLQFLALYVPRQK